MNICLFGAASDDIAKEYKDAAFELGTLIAAGGHTLIFGGGNTGVMGATARGAKSKSGIVIGVAPYFFNRDGVLYDDCDEFIITETMHERKSLLIDRSDAFVVLPGGIGTYDEFFEVIVLRQLGRHSKPVAVLNTKGYYTLMHSLLEKTIDEGFMTPECRSIYSFFDTPAPIIEFFERELGKK